MLKRCDKVGIREEPHPALGTEVLPNSHDDGSEQICVGSTCSQYDRRGKHTGRRQTNVASIEKVTRQVLLTEPDYSVKTSPCSMGEVRRCQASNWGYDPDKPAV